MTQAKSFRTGGQPSLGVGVMEVRYDQAPTATEWPTEGPFRAVAPTESDVLIEVLRVRNELQVFRYEVSSAHQKILSALAEQTWAARWRRFRLWVRSFFKE